MRKLFSLNKKWNVSVSFFFFFLLLFLSVFLYLPVLHLGGCMENEGMDWCCYWCCWCGFGFGCRPCTSWTEISCSCRTTSWCCLKRTTWVLPPLPLSPDRLVFSHMGCLTPSLLQHVKFPGWKMLGLTCKQYIFRSYSTSTFNDMRFDENPFTRQWEKEDRKA